jgi:polar amino acid transport system substrate-binding protein
MRRFHSGKARVRRCLLAVSAMAGLSLALPGLASAQSPTRSPKFDQALHDMLPAAIKSAGVISFGGLWETPPVISVDLTRPGVPKGIAPDLAAGMGEVLGVTIKWLNLAWPAQLPGLQAGNVDVLFGQISDTVERERSVVDLIPFQKRGYGLLTAAGNPRKLARLTDLCGVTVGIPIGSNTGAIIKGVSGSQCVGAGKPAIEQREFNGATAMVQALRAGSIDTVFDSAPSVAAVAASDPAAYSFVALPAEFMDSEYSAIAVAKDNTQLTVALAEALKKLIADGTYAAAYKGLVGMGQSALTPEQVIINPLTRTPVGKKL